MAGIFHFENEIINGYDLCPSPFSLLYFSPVLLAEIYRCSIAVKHPNSGAISCHSD